MTGGDLMATQKREVRYFEIAVALKSALQLQGGDTPQQAAQGQFATKADAPRELFEGIFGKLIVAIHNQGKTIEVNVEGGKWIVNDDSIEAPHEALVLPAMAPELAMNAQKREPAKKKLPRKKVAKKKGKHPTAGKRAKRNR